MLIITQPKIQHHKSKQSSFSQEFLQLRLIGCGLFQPFDDRFSFQSPWYRIFFSNKVLSDITFNGSIASTKPRYGSCGKLGNQLLVCTRDIVTAMLVYSIVRYTNMAAMSILFYFILFPYE
jgi:hypothetical protein